MHLAGADKKPILLAEDDEHDVLFMRLSFKKAGLLNPLITVTDGEEAINYLNGNGQYADRERFPLPCILLTDLKMPRAGGFEVLEWLRERPELNHIPAIVLSSSDEPQDRKRASELGAREYWAKPAQLEVLMQLVKHMRETWVASHCG